MDLAHATPDVIIVLDSLGLIDNDRWTTAAEPVFWRKQPRAWDMKIAADPRFTAAVANALDTMSKATRAKIAQLTTVAEADIRAHIAQHEIARADTLARFGPTVWRTPLPDTEQAIKSLEFMRRNDLDWLFFRHWRLSDGWLTPDAATRALEIFHDPLAIQMRKSVLSQLCQDQLTFAQQCPQDPKPELLSPQCQPFHIGTNIPAGGSYLPRRANLCSRTCLPHCCPGHSSASTKPCA